MFEENADIIDAFEGCAPDLLEAARAGGDKQGRIHISTAVEATYSAMGSPAPAHAAFDRIHEALREHYRLGRKQYIYLC